MTERHNLRKRYLGKSIYIYKLFQPYWKVFKGGESQTGE